MKFLHFGLSEMVIIILNYFFRFPIYIFTLHIHPV